MARRMDRFTRARVPEFASLADFGCGPAVMLLRLARNMPNCEFYGFDASRSVLSMDRNLAAERKLGNVHFHYAKLPEVPTAQLFDIVTCFATLHYLEEPMRAIARMYRAVRDGGFLVFNYPNRIQRAAYRREARKDPELARRFSLVLSGVNLLSRQVIEGSLGRRAEGFWGAVGERPQWSNPCVAVRRL